MRGCAAKRSENLRSLTGGKDKRQKLTQNFGDVWAGGAKQQTIFLNFDSQFTVGHEHPAERFDGMTAKA